MTAPHAFEHILASLHETVLGDSGWEATSALIDDALGSKGSFLVSGKGASHEDVEIFFAWFCFRGQRRSDLERAYFDLYHSIDERIPRLRRLPDSEIVPMSALYTESERKTSPAYNDALPISDCGDGLNVRLDGPDGSHTVWVIADPVDGDGWSSARLGTLRRLLPHIRQFVRVREALTNAQALGSSAAALLESGRCGVIYLDPRGRIVEANGPARALLRNRDGLADAAGRLHAATPRDDDRLQVLLAGALPRFGDQGTSGTMTVRRPARSARLALHVTPVGAGGREARPTRVAALVLVVDPLNRAPVDPDYVSAVLGLSPVEGHVAVMLAQGNTIRDTAAAMGRSPTTVRWHLQRIFAKLGISRQAELMRLVVSAADFPEGRR
ncbi:MAG: helix-turn-helix transcriptional regulator [Rhodospirillales bacterium]|nr:helix-turn-helix transcriptional regulator [Rhodospirillales bacterium]MDE0379222.1 helix-turn-helix transcriptional regulator [Rhodospirillales bacterium]